jgi:alpha-tubulin suppressor-like RCC1 family protein
MKNLLVFLLIIFSYCTTFSQDSLRFSFPIADISKTGLSPTTQALSLPAEPLTNYSTLWGFRGSCDMGQGTTFVRFKPIQITNDNWITATAGGNYSLGIKSDSTLWAWGCNGFGQYGNGKVTDSSLIPLKIGNDNNWKFVTAGFNCTFSIKTDGSLWAWGSNEYGVLGDSTKQDRPQPVQIGKNCLGKVRYISAGDYTMAAITEDGSLWTWGRNTDGQLGDGTNVNKYYPIKIGNTGEWKTVACNSEAIFAIKTKGTLWAWGRNAYNSFLGDGTTISHNKPIQIGTDTDWAEISTNNVTLALKTNGTLWAWGWNYYAGIGDGTLKDVLIPKQIGKDNDWVSVKSLYMRALGLK